MKALVIGIGAVFLSLLGATLFLAVRAFDGLVEDRYSAKAAAFVALREREEALGFSVAVSGDLAAGAPRPFRAVLDTAAGPLTGARVSLRAMRLSGPQGDRDFPLPEEAPGRYGGDVSLPAAGRWMLRLDVESPVIATSRTWIADARPSGPAPPPGDVHAGPVRGVAGGRTVVLDISPRPVRAMRELRFAVSLPGFRGDGVPWIDLSMPGMTMPPNRVDLARQADGSFAGAGLLVRCPAGGRTWAAAVRVPGGEPAVFTFDVAD